MRRRLTIILVLGIASIAAILLHEFQVQPPVTKSVSVFIDGYTNFGDARFAGAVITNHSSSAVRVWGWASFQGPLPSRFDAKHEPSEHGRLLAGGSSFRVLIPAPTNGTPWCAEFEVSHDSAYVRLIQRLRGGRFDWIKSLAGINTEPEIRAEVVVTERRTN